MKQILFTLITLSFIQNVYAESCVESVDTKKEDVVYEVNSQLPKHLKGAKITVTKADGTSSTVPAEKFMVVPRVQKTVVGQNSLVTSKQVCLEKGRKNLLIAEARRDFTELETTTKTVPNGTSANVLAKKELVPGINYFRRDILDSQIGAGVGVDANGTVKGMVGVEF